MLEFGAFCFGAVIGWTTYYTMRYSATHALSDIAVVIGAVGGAAVLALFPVQTTLFAAYGIGLAAGFFVYIGILLLTTLATEGAKGIADQSSKKNPFMNG
jgi:zinc transporter ZupT